MKRFNKITNVFQKAITRLDELQEGCELRIEGLEDQIVALSNKKGNEAAELRAASDMSYNLKSLMKKVEGPKGG